ncbi:hypothetical protein NIES2104_11250 [Leptolyngbya sp. NIES-2104]|nr:hypothetical protein NIES2104_11250 [Leptolyngbya sp. NIES-2104]
MPSPQLVAIAVFIPPKGGVVVTVANSMFLSKAPGKPVP